MICQHMSWSWEYLHHEIPFNTVRKILMDLPHYDYKKKSDDPGEIKEQSAAQFAAMMNNFTLD